MAAVEFYQVLDVVSEDPWIERHVGFFANKSNAASVAEAHEGRDSTVIAGFVRIHTFDDNIRDLLR